MWGKMALYGTLKKVDINFLGTSEQIQILREMAESGSSDWTKVLAAIRDDLRAEFKMPPERGGVVFFRMGRRPPSKSQ